MLKPGHLFFDYFEYSEFDSPDVKGSGKRMNDTFLLKLLKGRLIADTPFIITRGYNTPLYANKKFGTDDSSHVRGLGVDIACDNSVLRYVIVMALLSVGFDRIGIYDKHIHVDIDLDRHPEVLWIGVSK